MVSYFDPSVSGEICLYTLIFLKKTLKVTKVKQGII